MKPPVALATAAVALLLAAPAAAVPAATSGPPRTISHNTAAGDYALATTSGTATRPTRLMVRVSATPGQQVKVTWLVVCSRAGAAGSKRGQFNGTTPLQRRLVLPMRHTDSCIVSASAQLTKSGTVGVFLVSR